MLRYLWANYRPVFTKKSAAAAAAVLGFALLRFRSEKKAGRMSRSQCAAAFVLTFYVVMMLMSTVFSRSVGVYQPVNLSPFREFRRALRLRSWYSVKQIVLNVLMTMPVGILTPAALGKADSHKGQKTLLFGLVLSVFIESMQAFLKVGMGDVDDVINNVIGTAAGLGLYRLITRFASKRPLRYHKDKDRRNRKR
jgi:glycopeptide antibiotics resistance protein